MLYWFIVEGCDNIGKTTMIDVISKKLTANSRVVKLQHFGVPQGKTNADKIAFATNEAEDQVKTLRKLANVAQDDNDIILINDRSIFGELVYSKYRGYKAEHLQDITCKLQRVNNMCVTFIMLYGNATSALAKGIKFKEDSAEDYAQNNEMEKVSCAFIKHIHALNYPEARKLVFNIANYSNLDERNDYVYRHVRAIINDVPYKFKKTDTHVDTPFNAHQKIITDVGFSLNPFFVCKRYSTCPLGKEHKLNCKENGGYNSPIYGYGGMNPKVVLVGEVSHHNENFAGHLPFYNSVSGNLVQQALYDLNISPFDVYITNAIKCTPRNNDLGTYSNVTNASKLLCVNNVLHEINALEPRTKTIVCLGANAYSFTASQIKEKSGYVLERMNHPSYYARMGESDKLTSDLYKIIKGAK